MAGQGEPSPKRARILGPAGDDWHIFDIFKSKMAEKSDLEFSYEELRSNKMYAIAPMLIKGCNAAYTNKGYSFSKAACDTDIFECLYHFTSVFKHGEKILQGYLQDESVPENCELKLVLAKLLKFFLDEKCLKALEMIKKDAPKLNETKVAMRLGHHLFSKLSCSNEYKLDQLCHGKGDKKTCDCGCEEPFTGTFADTSIGHSDCWHGNIDILVDGAVPIEVPKKISDGSPGGKSPVEVKHMKKSEYDVEDPDVISQVVAQTIVFSFWQKQRHPMHAHFLTPSICISATSVVFYFYDCEHDILLRSPVFDLLNYKKKVNLTAILAVWLVINYKYLSSGLTIEMKTEEQKSCFHNIAKSKLELYQKHLSAEGIIGVNNAEPFKPALFRWKFM